MPSAREQFTSFYGAASLPTAVGMRPVAELLNRTDSFDTGNLGIDSAEISNRVGDENSLLSSVVGAANFPEIFEGIVTGIERFALSVEEQVAAGELLRRFGKPESLLAIPVFFNLANGEVVAKTETVHNAARAENTLRIGKRWLEQFILFAQLQLAGIEADLKLHQDAEEEVAATTVADGKLSSIKVRAKTKFSLKIKKLEQARTQIERVSAKLSQLLVKVNATGRSVTIFSRQTIAPSLPTTTNL